MSGWGNTFRKQQQDFLFGKAAFTNPNGVYYISLHSASPGPDGQAGTEITGANLPRIVTAAATWGSATTADPSVTANILDIQFAAATGAVGIATHVGLWRTLAGATAADFCGGGALGSSQSVGIGNAPVIPAGQITISYDSV
jgi:hypothetical protein